jgi:hypothetical protein
MNTTAIRLSTFALLAIAGSAHAQVFQASTDRVAYTGTVSRFANLADAQANANALGVFALPARATASPFNTPSRDVGMLISKNAPATTIGSTSWGFGGGDSLIFLSAWYYTQTGPGRFDGNGNPSNTNVGFTQLYDDNGSTVTSSAASWSDWNGSNFTTFNVSASGANADFDNDSSRLWNADGVNNFPSVTFGRFVSYDLNISFGGLSGIDNGLGLVEGFTHPTAVVGTFSAVFENTNVGNSYPTAGPDDNSFDGFYRADFTFNLDNWAFAQTDLVGGPIEPSYFLAVPTPGAASVLALGGLVAARRRRSR